MRVGRPYGFIAAGTLHGVTEPPNNDPYVTASEAARQLGQRTGVAAHDVALVMGSGWTPAADVLGETSGELPVAELPGFPAPSVAGHAGLARSVDIGGKRALVLLGRTHRYEGNGAAAVAHGVRTALAAGAGTVVLTNAAGGLRADFEVGQPVLVSDHLNMTGDTPLQGPRFTDLTDLYSQRLRERARTVDPTLAEGVYAGMPGPQYETPAEIRMLRTLGADLVGMSTVLEAIAAREGGAEVLGVSLVTNSAAGMTGEPLSHEEVVAAGKAAAERMGGLLREVVTAL